MNCGDATKWKQQPWRLKLNNKHIKIRNKLLEMFDNNRPRESKVNTDIISVFMKKIRQQTHTPFEMLRFFFHWMNRVWLKQSERASGIIVYISKKWKSLYSLRKWFNSIVFLAEPFWKLKGKTEKHTSHWTIWIEDTFVIILKPLAQR